MYKYYDYVHFPPLLFFQLIPDMYSILDSQPHIYTYNI